MKDLKVLGSGSQNNKIGSINQGSVDLMIPFFVVDRPISLKIIGGLNIPPGKQIGLMSRANTSANFRQAFREYSYHQAIKICDSAIFDHNQNKNDYAELYSRYEEMGANYGVMIDVIRDPERTIESAKRALDFYNQQEYTFKLVGVAQGRSVEEYLHCYEQLKELGLKYIAVGGLLHKRERSARYLKVRDEEMMREVLTSIYRDHKPGWLFALGCLHPSRLELFKDLNVWGDYKGWIFEYKKRDETLKQMVIKFSTNHLTHASTTFRMSAIGIELSSALSKRQVALRKSQKAHDDLLSAKRSLRDLIIQIEEVLRTEKSSAANSVAALKSRGHLQSPELKLILNALREINLENKYKPKLNKLIKNSREKKTKFLEAENKREDLNQYLLAVLKKAKSMESIDAGTKKLATELLKILGTSEQTYRIAQVRVYIESKILEHI